MMKWGKEEGLWVLVILLLTTGLSLISVHLPLGRYQGVSAYIGSEILKGKIIYRDLYHFNFPGIFFAYAFGFWLFGLKTEAVNYLALLFRLGTLIGVYLSGKKLQGAKAGLFSCLFYGLYSTILYNRFWLNAQKESFGLFFLVFGLYFGFSGFRSSSSIRKVWLWFISGFFNALAIYFKPTFGLGFVGLGFWIALEPEEGFKHKFNSLLSSCSGLLLGLLILIIYLWANGALGDMIDCVFIFGPTYGILQYRSFFLNFLVGGWKLFNFLLGISFLFGLGVVSVYSGFHKKESWARPLSFWLLALVLQIFIQLKFFDYHFEIAVGGFSLLGGIGWMKLREEFFRSGGIVRWGMVLVLVLLMISNLEKPFRRYYRELAYDLGMISQDDFLEVYGRWGFGDLCVQASYKVSRYLKEHTKEDEKVFVFGLEPGLNFLCGRSSPCRFSYDLPLTFSGGGKRFRDYQEGLRREFLGCVSSNSCKYIVIVEEDRSNIEALDSYKQMEEFSNFKEFLWSNYYLETKIEHYYLFARKESGF